MPRYTKEMCFKLHGYPDWYKQLKKENGNTKGQANMTNTLFDEDDQGKEMTATKWTPSMADLV